MDRRQARAAPPLAVVPGNPHFCAGSTRLRGKSSPRPQAVSRRHETATKGETVKRHELPDEMALMLNTTVHDVRSASIQDLDRVCHSRGSSLLVVVRGAESALQRCQENRDRHVQTLGHDDEVLDGPAGPPP